MFVFFCLFFFFFLQSSTNLKGSLLLPPTPPNPNAFHLTRCKFFTQLIEWKLPRPGACLTRSSCSGSRLPAAPCYEYRSSRSFLEKKKKRKRKQHGSSLKRRSFLCAGLYLLLFISILFPCGGKRQQAAV